MNPSVTVKWLMKRE